MYSMRGINHCSCMSVLRSRSRGAEIKSPPAAGAWAGAEFTNCGFVSDSSSGSFLFIKDLKIFYRQKIMVAKEVFVNHHNFNPIWVQHASIHVQKYWYASQKRYLSRYLIKFIRNRGWSRSRIWRRRRNSDLRLRGAGAERNNFGSATLGTAVDT